MVSFQIAAVGWIIAMLVMFALKNRYFLIFVSGMDILAGLMLMSLRSAYNVELLVFNFPGELIFYLGILIVIKGAYSLTGGLR